MRDTSSRLLPLKVFVNETKGDNYVRVFGVSDVAISKDEKKSEERKWKKDRKKGEGLRDGAVIAEWRDFCQQQPPPVCHRVCERHKNEDENQIDDVTQKEAENEA